LSDDLRFVKQRNSCSRNDETNPDIPNTGGVTMLVEIGRLVKQVWDNKIEN